MDKTDFKPFTIGTVFNPISVDSTRVKEPFSEVVIDYPSRLEAMVADPSKIATNANLHYTPGQVDFTVELFKTITVRIVDTDGGGIDISPTTSRTVLVRHAVSLMRAAIGFKHTVYVDVKDTLNMRHCGLGSSSGLIAGVSAAVNELFGKPVDQLSMVKYLAQNHGEEIDGNEELINPVQCIGGSAASGMYAGAVKIISGENVVIAHASPKEDYAVLIGVPKAFKYPDSKYLMDKEIENLHKFMYTGQMYGHMIAYRLFHEALPALVEGNLIPLGDLIFDYRFRMGSIENCSFVYPPILDIAKKLEHLKIGGIVDVLALSSVGPGFFAITKHPEKVKAVFEELDMNILQTRLHKGEYKVISIS